MKIERKRIAELKAAPYNPRKISVAAMKGLRQSLKRFGLVQPIVWNKRSGLVVGGHQRLVALRAEGAAQADVVVVDLDDKDERALNITLNNPKIGGDFTPDLDVLLEEIRDQDSALFHDLKLDELLPKENSAVDELEYATKFQVVVEVATEVEQRDLYERLKSEGHKVKVLQL